MEPLIRPMRADDVEYALAQTAREGWDIAEGGFSMHLQHDPGGCFIAEVDGAVAGQTMITREWSDWRDGWFWWIQSVFVDPAYRQRGVFRALHTHIRNEAMRDPDVCGLRLYVHHDNERAIKTYKKLDMVVTEYDLCEEELDGRG